MHRTARRTKIVVSADGTGLVSQAGALLLVEAARVTGLGGALGFAPGQVTLPDGIGLALVDELVRVALARHARRHSHAY